MKPWEIRLVHDPLALRALLHPERPAIENDGSVIRYGELWAAVLELAAGFASCGLERGDRLLIVMDNSPAVAVSIYAASLAGATFSVINPQTKPGKLSFLMSDSEARMVVADARHRDEVEAALRETTATPIHLTVDSRGAIEDIDHANGVRDPHQLAVRTPTAIPTDLAALIYTSGSTGEPKGVMMTHQNMVFAAGSIAQYLRLIDEHRILCAIPLSFDYGLYQVLMGILVGATVIIEKEIRFPGQLIDKLRSSQATVFPSVPTTFATLVQLHERQVLSFPAVQRVTNTAAALPPAHVRVLREIFPSALIYKMYGLTECKRVCYLEPELVDEFPASVGRAMPGTEVFLLDDAGREVPAGEPGILHVRGPHVMQGYWRRPEETAAMLCPGPTPGERMLRTGDWFVRDELGLLYFRGRSDDIIKSRGQKVSPREIENVLLEVPGVSGALVVGVFDEQLGQAIRAFVERSGSADIDQKTLARACRLKLENDHVPRDFIVLDRFPTTPNGKVDRKALAEWSTEFEAEGQA